MFIVLLFLIIVLHQFLLSILSFISETLIKIVTTVLTLAWTCTRLRFAWLSLTLAVVLWCNLWVPPTCSRFSRIHLAKKKSQHCLSIFPVKISQFNSDTLICRQQTWWLLLLRLFKICFFAIFAFWVYQWQELWSLWSLDFSKFFLQLKTFFLFYLLHRFKEELFYVWTLV